MTDGILADNDAVVLDIVDVDPQSVLPDPILRLLSSLSRDVLKSLANAAASELTANHTKHHTFSHENVTVQHTPSVNEAYVAMCTIVAKCAQDGIAQTPAEQRQQLNDVLGVKNKDLQSKLILVLSDVVPRVGRVLESISFDFTQVVDVSWRLDYVLRSSNAGSVHEPFYFLQLQLQSPCGRDSGLQKVVFTCSVEELRVLVYRIQEAANEVEKLVAGSSLQY